MASAIPTPTTHSTLSVTRTFAAPRERVFRAWTDPAALKSWWVPREGFSVPRAEVDLRVGGTYRITMQNPQGEVFALTGVYREVRSPERLVYTWRWEGTERDDGEMLVTVDFREHGPQTEVAIRHEQLPSAHVQELHRQGWTGCLERLTGCLGGR